VRNGLKNPNSIGDIRELRFEIANELGITDMEQAGEYKNNMENAEINKKVAEKFRYNLIGFK